MHTVHVMRMTADRDSSQSRLVVHLRWQVAHMRHTEKRDLNRLETYCLQKMHCQVWLAEAARIAPKLLLLIP